MPKVSVIIPTYNRADMVGDAIQSVLQQTFEDYELIVVDDGSVDDTLTVVGQYTDARLRYIYQENAGGPAARNRGWQNSIAEHILFLDSDDLLLPYALEALFTAASAHPNAGLIGGGFQYIDAQGTALGEAQPWILSEQLDLARWVLECPLIPSATFVRRGWLELVAGFDPEQEAAQDWDLWLRLAASGCPMAWLKRPVCRYRLHPGGLTADLERQKRGAIRALDKVFAREDVSPHVLSLRGEAYAGIHIYAAAREYAAGQLDQARQDVLCASTFVPEWIDSGVLLERLIRMGELSIVTRDQRAYVNAVLKNLPEVVFHPGIRRRAIARVAAASLFADYQRRDWSRIGRLWWQVILNDPAWLGNTGVLSIGLRCLIGSGTVSRLLSLYRSLSGNRTSTGSAG